ncbi:MAG: D-alanyl-D-alanine carboxypeptidase/D-alanyl-D-alanine-endopeptidase [Acidobacteria bacterium]|nr:MAG: D-alanyl-D-alanine carboxypeptidase/D-alanyl-D-alanine-endopeptidase [Acidobacteriota bacterium]PYV70778.1 MAG: D-alanyl-D-alanine carboxypeptidase/D-alanyl-D-alanine-endopeptidase [Acidobacteriota bacterium]
MFRRSIIPLLICMVFALQMQAATHKPHVSLKKQIETILSQPDLSRGFWGIEISSVANGRVLYSLNPEKLFTPASNTKLFTTAAALALIGPDYKFRTTIETSGSLDKYGRLSGDLVLIGRGDPTLSGRQLPYTMRTQRDSDPVKVLEQLADELVQKGVKYIDGDVVADDSYFAFERYGEGWSQDDLVWAEGAPVSALTINDNVVFVNILPGARPGDKAFVSLTPFADYYTIDNRLMTTPAGTARKLFINREPGSTLLTLWGSMPIDDPGANEGLAIEDPAQFAANLFRHLLSVRGIAVYGKERTRHTELASLSTFTSTVIASRGGDEHSLASPAGALVLAEYQSAPLSDDIRVINKVSQNLHAEILLRLLGREKGTGGTVQAGLEVLRGFLNTAGISSDDYSFFDGSGLSRENLVTPRAVVQLLRYAATQPWGKEFHDSLPTAGVDGSLADRFKDLDTEAQVYAKTGSLGGVKTLSGYAVTAKGEQLAFSVLTNNLSVTGKRINDVIDSVVVAAANNGKK